MLRIERGMTAIEILIVLILAGMLTLIALPRLAAYRSLVMLRQLARSHQVDRRYALILAMLGAITVVFLVPKGPLAPRPAWAMLPMRVAAGLAPVAREA